MGLTEKLYRVQHISRHRSRVLDYIDRTSALSFRRERTCHVPRNLHTSEILVQARYGRTLSWFWGFKLVRSALEFGRRVNAIANQGKAIILGGSGRAVVYQFGERNWVHPGYNLTGNEFSSEKFGYTLAISADGNTVAVGDARGYGGTGSVTAFRLRGINTWEQLGRTMVGELGTGYELIDDPGLPYGMLMLSADGNTVAVSGRNSSRLPSQLKVFRYHKSDWIELDDSVSDNNTDEFPCALSGDGNTVCCGSPYDLLDGNDIGLVRCYRLQPKEP